MASRLYIGLAILLMLSGLNNVFAIIHFPVPEEEVDLHISVDLETENRTKRFTYRFPDSFHIDVSVDGNGRRISLQRNHNVTDDVPVLLMRSGKVKKYRFDSTKHAAFYSNFHTGASFMVWSKNSSETVTSTDLNLFGTFKTDGQEYLIQPPTRQDRKHTVGIITEANPVLSDFIFAEDSVNSRTHTKQRRNHHTNNREKRAAPNYEVEILFVIDFSIYSLWYDKTTGEPDREAATVELIKQFYAFVLNSIDVRYQSVTGRTFTIRCKYAGIFISDSQSSASYIEDHVFPYGATQGFIADTVLPSFATWAEANLAPTSNYDHGMMFTSYEMGRNETGTFTNATAGFAYVGGVCTTTKYSINEDTFQANMATVAAHELGHNLDASHDGTGNACLDTDGYIMAPSSGASSDPADNQRLWLFSSCSLDYFESHLDTLGPTNCMTSIDSADTSGLDAYSNDLAGQIYPPDIQCEIGEGAGSYMFRGYFDGDYSDFCSVMGCSSPENDGSYTFYIPWEGSTCGNGSICRGGHCVADSGSPLVDDESCVFGDVPYNVFGQTQTCASFLGTNATSYWCYQSSYRKSCCATCEDHRQNNLAYTDCTYGDKNPGCATITLYQCYANEALCCNFCKRNALHIANCTYGDKASGCDPSVCHVYTDETRAQCCETCAPETTTSAATSNGLTTTTVGLTTTTTTTTTGGQIIHSSNPATTTGITTLDSTQSILESTTTRGNEPTSTTQGSVVTPTTQVNGPTPTTQEHAPPATTLENTWPATTVSIQSTTDAADTVFKLSCLCMSSVIALHYFYE